MVMMIAGTFSQYTRNRSPARAAGRRQSRGERQREAAAVLDHPAGHHILGDGGNRRERNVDAAGDQHHEQPAGGMPEMA